MADRRLWTPQEDEVILRLIEEHGTTQWTAIALQMRGLLSHSRTSKQIRQRWYNQLSPFITRSPWSTQEEAVLFTAHSQLGNRWKDIAHMLPGRTDNSVKNHFYSTVRRALRRLDKHFGFRDSTKKMRELKPAALTLLLETARTLPDFAEMMALLLQFAQWKPSRTSKQLQPQHGRELYQNIIEMINQFNKNYRRNSKQFKEQAKEEITNEPSQEADCMSTVSNEQEQSVSNYFGSVAETRSWFNVNQREWGTQACQSELRLLCDQDTLQ